MNHSLIDDLRVRKEHFEMDLLNSISKLTYEFARDTGLTPSAINVHLFPVNSFESSIGNECVVGKCSVTIDI